VARAARQRLRAFLTGVVLVAAAGAAAATLPAVEARHGMVVAEDRRAAEIGRDILQAGGNAIDAAVAVGYALAVVNPCCGNLGGGGFMTIHLVEGRDTVIDFRETAPAAATAGLYLGADGKPIAELSRRGWRAAGVPGTVSGLDRAARAYGRLPRRTLIAPAAALAREGYVLSPADAELFDAAAGLFKRDPAAAEIFLRPDRSPLAAGDRLVQRDLAAVLAAIAEHGPDAFYDGPVAAMVDKASRANGGILTAADFARYHAVERRPLSCAYRGYLILSPPPPSSGGVTMCEILGILAGYDIKALGFRGARSVRLMVEAMRHAYADRSAELGDPDFVENPVDRLLSPVYAQSIRAAIKRGAAAPATVPAHERPETTHFSVVDDVGNAVATTYTLNGYFGAGVVAPGTGFLLNNEMDDFTVSPARRTSTASFRARPMRSRPANGRSRRWRRPSSRRTARCFSSSAARGARASSRPCSKRS
jgi:gamma-glutamyltranspeptidase/glutathione hydrolase